jgi:hypothetical protein
MGKAAAGLLANKLAIDLNRLVSFRNKASVSSVNIASRRGIERSFDEGASASMIFERHSSADQHRVSKDHGRTFVVVFVVVFFLFLRP